jgi:formylglycine-generating enzyme required for sulfatase activity
MQTPSLPKTFTNALGMEFVVVPRGKSWLGGGGGTPGPRAVRIIADFYLGKYEVTQEEWQKVMGNNPSYFSRTGPGKEAVKNISDADLKRFPVESVSWSDCQAIISRLNDKVGEPGWLYRLPTHTEWEYACRGGPLADPSASAFDFYFSKPMIRLPRNVANFMHPGFLNRTRKVGSYPPNSLGLCDMHGNVGESCLDDGQPANAASGHMGRGGSWHAKAFQCTASAPGTRTGGPLPRRGLRVARVQVSITQGQGSRGRP